MPGRFACQLLVVLLCSIGLAQGCRSPEQQTPDVTPPHTFAIPAGGIYHTLPAEIRLQTAAATLYYRWQDGKEQQYTAPIRVPEATTGRLTLHYWTQDAAGNKAPWRREHYVLEPRATPVEILELDRPVLGTAETATLQWRSTASAATYEIAVTTSGWEVAAGALEVLDVQRPQAPVRQAIRRLAGTYGVAVLPPYVLVASGTEGVQVVPLDSSQAVSRLRTTHYAARLAVRGQQAWVGDTQGGLRLVDMAPHDQPRLLAGLQDIGTIVDVAVDGPFAYLADDRHGRGVVVVDISVPTRPRVVGAYHSEATNDVVVWNNLALLGDEAGIVYLNGRPGACRY
jgi:hypothetical protein